MSAHEYGNKVYGVSVDYGNKVYGVSVDKTDGEIYVSARDRHPAGIIAISSR